MVTSKAHIKRYKLSRSIGRNFTLHVPNLDYPNVETLHLFWNKEHWQFCHRLFSKETLQITWLEGQCEHHWENKPYIQFILADCLFATASAKCFEEIKFGVPFPSLFCDWFRLRLPLVVRTMLPAGVEAASCPFCFTCRLFCNSKNYMKNIRTLIPCTNSWWL